MAWLRYPASVRRSSLPGCTRIVVDARHHVGAAEALGILERGVGDQLAGLQVEEAQHDGGGAEVHGDAVGGRSAEPSTSRARVGSPTALPLDAHVAAPHGVAANLPAVARHCVRQDRRKLPLRCRSRSARVARGSPCPR